MPSETDFITEKENCIIACCKKKMKRRNKKYRFTVWLLLPFLALLTFLATELLAANPQWTEAVYPRKIYPVDRKPGSFL